MINNQFVSNALLIMSILIFYLQLRLIYNFFLVYQIFKKKKCYQSHQTKPTANFVLMDVLHVLIKMKIMDQIKFIIRSGTYIWHNVLLVEKIAK